MDLGFSNYNTLSLDELLDIKKDIQLNLQILQDKLFEIEVAIKNIESKEKPQPIELGVHSINSEEVVKFR